MATADSTSAASMALSFRVDAGVWNSMLTLTNTNSLVHSVGTDASPDSAICTTAEGVVDFRLVKECEAAADGGIPYTATCTGDCGGSTVLYIYSEYTIDWDGDEDDCDCYLGVTGRYGIGFEPGLSASCCGDDGSEFFKTGPATRASDRCCNAAGDCVSSSNICVPDGSLEAGDECQSGTWADITPPTSLIVDSVAGDSDGYYADTDDDGETSIVLIGGETGIVCRASTDNVEYDLMSPYVDCTGTTIVTCDISLGQDAAYTYYIACKDSDGNSQTGSDIINVTFDVDWTPPTASIMINDNESYTSSTRVTLNMTYSDPIGTLRDCSYNEDNITWTSWETCVDSKSWNLLDSDGVKTIYYRVRDLADHITYASDSIFLDQSKAKVSILDNYTYTTSVDVNLTFDFTDMVGDPDLCSYKNDGESWSAWEDCLTGSEPDPLRPVRDWTLKNESGVRTVTVMVNTTLGIIKFTNDTIVLDTVAPWGSIDIYSINVPGFHSSSNDTTAYATVNLMLEYEDDMYVSHCTFANEVLTDFTPPEPCQTVKPWVLDDEEGSKIVYYRIYDDAGNFVQYNSTIYYNSTGAGLDDTPPNMTEFVVMDEGLYTIDNASYYVSWSGAYDRESEVLSIPLFYYVALGTTENGTDICDFTSAGSAEYITLDSLNCPTGFDLPEGDTIYATVKVVNSAKLNGSAVSDGIVVDTQACVIDITLPEFDAINWSINDNPSFAWSGSDATSGAGAYSFVLNTDQSTIPDQIPEGDPADLSAKTSHTYTNVIDGKLYFHARCRDNAGNWGDTETREIWIDSTKPTTPFIYSPLSNASNITGKGNWTFTWTPSSDISGIYDYYFTLNNSETGVLNFSAWTGNRTSITIENLTSQVVYIAEVRALNGAGLLSSASPSMAEYDVTGPGIDIIVPTDGCTVAKASTALRVITDEDSSCEVRHGVISVDMAYTGGVYHEYRIPSASSPNTARVYCTDRYGNEGEGYTQYFIAENASIVFDSGDPLDPTYNAYAGIKKDLQIHLNLGGADESDVRISVDGRNLSSEEYAVTEKTCSIYDISFIAPKMEGIYDIELWVGEDHGVTQLNVSNLFFNVSFVSPEVVLSSADLVKVTYGQVGNITVGIASESVAVNITSSGNIINLLSDSHDAPTYIFATGANNYVKSVDKSLEEGTFAEAINPNFGSEVKEVTYRTSVVLEYDYSLLSGFTQLAPGRYTMTIRNLGIDPVTGKDIIELTVS